MIEWYTATVREFPLISAMIQFAILGTLGDAIARKFTGKKIPLLAIPFKMIEWALLGVIIKLAFKGFGGFLDALIAQHYLPALEKGSIGYAFAYSVVVNLQFGLLMVLLHRLLDNIVDRKELFGKNSFANIGKGFMSLIWFWFPAHTLTFSLPVDLQIGLAAFWSVVLGLILGLFNKKK